MRFPQTPDSWKRRKKSPKKRLMTREGEEPQRDAQLERTKKKRSHFVISHYKTWEREQLRQQHSDQIGKVIRLRALRAMINFPRGPMMALIMVTTAMSNFPMPTGAMVNFPMVTTALINFPVPTRAIINCPVAIPTLTACSKYENSSSFSLSEAHQCPSLVM